MTVKFYYAAKRQKLTYDNDNAKLGKVGTKCTAQFLKIIAQF